ncbi:hypothetical protein LTR08_008897 [Meristemomyces frigidus]|nr:hypothetical protein LTR08_008897 [Meristemomyces frigidus]
MPYVNGYYVAPPSASSYDYSQPSYHQPTYPQAGSRNVSPLGAGRFDAPYSDSGPPSRTSSARRPSGYEFQRPSSRRPSAYGSERSPPRRPSAYDSDRPSSRRPSAFSFERSPPQPSSAYESDRSSSRRPSAFGAEQYEVREPAGRRYPSSRREPANDYTGTDCSIGRRSAVRRTDESRYRPVAGDIGTYGGDIYSNLPERRPPPPMPYQSSRRGSERSLYGDAGYSVPPPTYSVNERQPVYQSVNYQTPDAYGSYTGAGPYGEPEPPAPRRTHSSRHGSSRHGSSRRYF